MIFRMNFLNIFYNCRKFRQFSVLFQWGRAGILIVLLGSCGAKAPNKRVAKNLYANEMSLLMIEKQCAASQPVSPTTNEINNLFEHYRQKNPFSFIMVPVKQYDYKNPLRISPVSLKKSLDDLLNTLNLSAGELGASATDLFHLYQNANRFDSVRCSFNSLAQKKINDFRPFMEVNTFCEQKDNSALCSDQTLRSLTLSESKHLEEQTLKLCQSFAKETNCWAQLITQKRQLRFPDMVKHYQNRFEKERFNTLFQLRPNHLKFSCSEANDDSSEVKMNIKVFKGQWKVEELSALLDYVSQGWSRNNFKLIFEIVEEKNSENENVIEILPTKSFISYVSDNNYRVVYLSEKLDFNTRKKVLAHEFGHVLGFPDCYVEFFDEKEKELVYYEHNGEVPNIMCSLKNGVQPPHDYLKQLREKSCLFH